MANPNPDWEVRVFNGVRQLKATYDNRTNPGGIIGGFEFTKSSGGDCLFLQFNVAARAPDGTQNNTITQGDIVQLLIDGVPVAFNVVDEAPDPSNPNEAPIVAGNARVLLRDAETAYRKFGAVSDAATVLLDTASGYRRDFPLGVLFNASQVQTDLGSLTRFELPGVQLGDAIDALAKVAFTQSPIAYGVDGNGEFFFREPSGVLEVNWTDIAGGQPLQVTGGANIVTRVNLILDEKNPFFRNDPPIPSLDGSFFTQTFPITYRWRHARDAEFGRSITRALGYGEKYASAPVDTPVFHPSAGDWTVGSMTDEDGNTVPTYTTLVNGAYLEYNGLGDILGVQVRYASALGGSGEGASLFLGRFIPPLLTGKSGFLPSKASLTDWQFSSLVEQLHNVDSNTVVSTIRITNLMANGTPFVVRNFAPIRFAPSLENVARNRSRLPLAIGRSVELIGYHSPVKTLRILDSPSGDLEADTSEWKYAWTLDGGFVTSVQLGDPNADADVRAVRQLDQDYDRRNITITRGILGG